MSSSAKSLSLHKAIEECFDRGFSDGLPVVPPTREAVEAMCAGVSVAPDSFIAFIPPKEGKATVEKIAVNAVMAGCRPEYMPVVLAAVRAVTQEEFNLRGIQATTGSASPMLIVNGPVAKHIEMNAGHGCLGPGNRANATIGRAIRLVMQNLGGGIPGKTDKSTFGHPGKYTYCFAENEDASPWEPLHVERGFLPGESTVTAFACNGPTQLNDHVSSEGYGILRSLALGLGNPISSAVYGQGEMALILSQEHARDIARSGFSKREAKQYIREHSKHLVGALRDRGDWGSETLQFWPRWIDIDDDEALVPTLRSVDDLIVVVAGGETGRFSLCAAGWGSPGSQSVTVKIEG